MLGWIIAAACMWRGLTSDEADAVEAEVRGGLTDAGVTDPLIADVPAGYARDVLDAAVAAVLARTR